MNSEDRNIHQEIEHYIEGKLTEKETEELWTVLIQKEEYMDYLKAASNLRELDPPEGAVPDHYLTKLVYAGAAIVLVLAIVFGVTQLTDFNTGPEMQPIATIELPFERSADMTAAGSERDQIIRDTVILYYNDGFEEAVRTLEAELAQAENADWQARLNITLGTLYYNEGNYETAKDYFQTAAAFSGQIKPLRLEKAYWYLANTWYQLSEVEKAENAMRQVLEIDGAYSRLASKYLEAMN